MIDALLFEPAYWNWLLAGLILLIVEILLPGTFFLWTGAAAIVVGLILALFPALSWQYHWLIFIVVSLVAVGSWQFYVRRRPVSEDLSGLNRGGHQHIGRTFTLDTPIVDGQSRVRIGDSTWKILGEDCQVGSRVRVTGVEGIALRVDRIGNEKKP